MGAQVLLIVAIALFLAALLAVGAWQLAPRYRRTWWNRGEPGSIWFHGPTGTIVPEDEEFKKPPDEGDLL